MSKEAQRETFSNDHEKIETRFGWLVFLFASLWSAGVWAVYPAPWPSTSNDWVAYSYDGVGLNDAVQTGAQDPSKGQAAPGGLTEVMNASGGAAPDNASAYWYYDAGNEVVFFRVRIEDDPITNQGALGQAVWDIVLDIDGDGYKELLIELDGKGPAASEALRVYYDNNDTQTVASTSDCTGGAGTEGVVFSRSPYDGGGNPAVFQSSSVGADPDYYLDFQVPLSALTDCNGNQLIDETTPIGLGYATSDAQADPTQKDLTFDGTFKPTAASTLPFGDPLIPGSGTTQDPQVAEINGLCSGTTVTIDADIMDTLGADTSSTPDVATSTVSTVNFQYRQLVTGTWTDIANATAPTAPTLNPWSYTWDLSGLAAGSYLVRVYQAADDDGNTGESTRNTDYLRIEWNGSTCTVTTTPVTLSYFRAKEVANGVRLDWSTATETGNVGFNLYSDANAEPLNIEPIPSAVIDSTVRQDYRYELPDTAGEVFFLEDMDILGRTKLHGPFRLGEIYGRRNIEEPVDWHKVREQSEAKAVLRAKRGRKHKAALPATGAVGEVRLVVREDGLYRVSYEQLAAAGFDLAGVSQKTLALTNKGAAVPIYVFSVDRKAFGPGSYIDFVGQGLDTLYTDANVYVLMANRKKAARFTTDRSRLPKVLASHYQAKTRVEENVTYSFASPSGDPWYQASILAFSGQPVERTFDIVLDSALSAPAELAVHLWGGTDWPGVGPDHHVEFLFNDNPVKVEVGGTLVDGLTFDGLQDHRVRLPLEPGLVKNGTNTLTLRSVGDLGIDYDLVHLESFTVTYPRPLQALSGSLTFTAADAGFQIHGFDSPKVVAYRTGGQRPARIDNIVSQQLADGSWQISIPGDKRHEATYHISSADALLQPEIAAPRPDSDITGGWADLLIISHPDFLDGLNRLVAAREAEGLIVRVVDVLDVYEQFGHGITSAHAIKDYISQAAESMDIGYVLLVGGDSYDYRDYTGKGSLSFVPSLYAQTDEIVRYAPVDPKYGDLDNDGIPDIPVGRFPVRNDLELEHIIQKTLEYRDKSYPRSAVFAADRYDNAQGLAFTDTSNEIIAQLPNDWRVTRAYLDDHGGDAAGVAPTRGILVDSINKGVALTSYIGHSSTKIWSFKRLFTTTDAANLTNRGKPTIVTQWGCWNTYYVHPTNNSMGSTLTISGLNGAAAIFGATTLTGSESGDAYGQRLIPRLVEPGATIGDAMIAAKRALAAEVGPYADILYGSTLLGDPTLVVQY